MKFYINKEEVTQEVFDEKLEDAVTQYVNETFDDVLDECYEEYKMGALTFSPSQILKKCDPIAYRTWINEYIDNDLLDARYEVYHGEKLQYGSLTFNTECDDEDLLN